jgi:hypothetical protein
MGGGGGNGGEKLMVVADRWLERKVRSVAGKRGKQFYVVEREINLSKLRVVPRGGRSMGKKKEVRGEEKKRILSSK